MENNNNWKPDDWQNTVKEESAPKRKSWETLKNDWNKRSNGEGPSSDTRVKRSFLKWGLSGLILIGLLFLVIFLFLSSYFLVHEGETGYVVQFGKIVRVEEAPGLHFHLPFVQSSGRVTAKMMLYDVSPSEVLTTDKKAMIVDSYALWKIVDVTKFNRSVGSIQEVQKRIDASVYSNIKNIMGRMLQNEIISDEGSTRDSLNKRITEEVASELKGYGVLVSRVEIRRYDLPEDNLSAVHKRMISERRQMAARYKADGEKEAAKIRNKADKDCEIMVGEATADAQRLRGEAEQAYMQVLGELYGDKDVRAFYEQMLGLDALESLMQGKKTLVLGEDSPITKLITEGPLEDK